MTMGECGACKGTGLEKTPEPILINKDVNDHGKKEDNKEQYGEVNKSSDKAATNNAKRKK